MRARLFHHQQSVQSQFDFMGEYKGMSRAEYLRRYYLKNKAHLKEQSMKRYYQHSEQIKKSVREYGSLNKAHINLYHRERRKIDSNFRLIESLRGRVLAALGGKSKAARTLKLIGCTIPEWKQWLEFQFVPGMTWENYGPVWHVDHIRPCASFDFTDPEQQKECFHFANTQPLFAIDNLRKGAKYIKE